MTLMKGNVLVFVVVATIFVGYATAFSHAATILTDNNSTATIDPTSQAGMYQWTVDGKNYLAKQWFWYSIDSGPLKSLDTLTSTLLSSSANEALYQLSDGANFEVKLACILLGGAAGTGEASITEQFYLTNKNATSETVHFFQYSDFNLSTSDTVKFLSPNYVQQIGGGVIFGEDGSYAEELTNNRLKHHQAGIGSTILDALNAGPAMNLTDANGPLTGDANWAFQWDVVVPGNGASNPITIIKNLSIAVPEPASMTLLCLGAVLAGGVRWLRKRR
jgi:hypothetical protein